MRVSKEDPVAVLARFDLLRRGKAIADLPEWRCGAFCEQHARMTWPPAPRFRSQLQEATPGAGAWSERTRREQFLGIELPLPIVEDQLRIVDILKRLLPRKAKHVAIRQANVAMLSAMRARVFAGNP